MTAVLPRALGVWALLVVLAIINGTVREKLFVPALGHAVALPLSGVTLSAFILLITYLLLPFLKASSAFDYWLIGGFWLALTLLFEFVFGHFIAKKPWSEILTAYDIRTGNLWLLVLAVTFLSSCARLSNTPRSLNHGKGRSSPSTEKAVRDLAPTLRETEGGVRFFGNCDRACSGRLMINYV